MHYQELIADHDRIDILATALDAEVRAEQRAPAVDDLLGRLAQEVDAHLTKEDSLIYPRLLACVDPAGAESLVIEFEALKQDWQSYLLKWHPLPPAGDWPAFCQETAGMVQRLRERVRKESGLLYAMALRENVIAMDPAA